MPKPPSFSRPPAGMPPRASVAELLQNGLRAHQAGRADEATQFYRKVLAREPSHPGANHLLGVLALQAGRPADAIGLIERAIRANANDAQYHLNLGVAFNATGRTADAIAAFQRAVALRPDLAGAHSNLGMALRAAGRIDEAVAAYERAVTLAPVEPGFRFNLANALAHAGAVEPAFAAYREALRLRPLFPAALSGLVQICDEAGRNTDALATTDEALARHPGVGELHMLRGRVLYRLNRLAEAESALREAVRIAPRLGEAWFHLANMLRWSADGPGLETVSALAKDPGASVDDRLYAGFAHGRMLADLGRHDESVRAYEAANRLGWQRAGGVQRDYEAELAPIARPFEHPAPGLLDGGVRGARPIFIIGLPRSGKSTLEAILGRHPEVRAAGELPVLQRLVTGAGDSSSLTPDIAAGIGRAYLDEIAARVGPGRRSIDTMPPNFRFVGHIRAALPDAIVIHAVRNPASQRMALLEKFLPRAGYEYAMNVDALLAYERAYFGLMARWRALFGDFVIAFDLAAFDDSGIRARHLLDLCGLAWHADCATEVESEPVLGDWTAEMRAANAACQLAAWQRLRPEIG